MKKSKGILAAGILGAAAIVVKKKLEAEPVRKHLIPRHWDEQEIKERMQSFTEELATGDEEGIGSFFLGKEGKHFNPLKGQELTFLETHFLSLFKVKGNSDNNLRGLISYRVATAKKEYTYLIKVARLNVGEKLEWYIQKVVQQDRGIKYPNQYLLQLTPIRPHEELCQIETDAGTITMRLFQQDAPKAVKNWRGLAKQGFYDGTPFARVIKDFVIQGGALDGSGNEAESIYGGYFEDEVDEGLYHFDGAVCLGNHGPNTNGNQFYIVERNHVDQEQLYRMNLPLKVRSHYEAVGGIPELDGRYTVFGQVIEGMAVVREIADQVTNEEDAPLNPIRIQKITFKKASQS
ncbi:peptidylprolyl isomerase [Candidatus Enterococcus murrayae]|uniref:peptidylprolyl isomerase n=1 Tax=Candidatus Enterococcus murrayae TaxID=2815321 RepID=A0ABS3HGB9_9ENTE|nr:peptidylprolyl isomerase [Enterococcus sp. MJM16]MBO0452501.1 peptidylprolyl isomerase [Enterococcus sp. MJM16]